VLCIARCVIDHCCWVLGVVLGVGCWVLRCWMLGVGCWVLGVGCWVLGVGCWVLGVGCWVFGGVGCIAHLLISRYSRRGFGGCGVVIQFQ
jgi:hypothetical protein